MNIREIASALAVAPSTVSNVLNGKPGVGSELREAIIKMLTDNGYTIREKDSESDDASKKTIFFIYYQSTDYISLRDDMTLAFMIEVQRECQFSGCQFFYYVASEKNIKDVFSPKNLKNIDGIVLLCTEYYEDKLHPAIISCGIPVVLLDGYFPSDPIDTIATDNSYAINYLLNYLSLKGHHNIGYVKSNIPLGNLQDRCDNILNLCSKYSCVVSKKNIIEVRHSAEDIVEDTVSYLKENYDSLPSVFICDNDYIAAAVSQSIQKAGLKIPDDISIVGFDNSELSKMVFPRITTFESPFKYMAKLAAERILMRINNPDVPYIRTSVGLNFVEGDSVADLNKS